jgi:hypothetical protein
VTSVLLLVGAAVAVVGWVPVDEPQPAREVQIDAAAARHRVRWRTAPEHTPVLVCVELAIHGGELRCRWAGSLGMIVGRGGATVGCHPLPA